MQAKAGGRRSEVRGQLSGVRNQALRALLLFSFQLSAFSFYFAQSIYVPYRWTVNTAWPASQPLEIRRGEYIALEPSYLSYNGPIDLSNCTEVRLRYRHAAMAAGTYYAAPGTVINATNGQVRIVWGPDQETAQTNYVWDILLTGADSASLRAYGTLKLSGPISVTYTSAPPMLVTGQVDWATLEHINLGYAPFVLPTQLTAVSNALAAAQAALSNNLVIAYRAADVVLSNALASAWAQTVAALSNNLAAAYAGADAALSNNLDAAWALSLATLSNTWHSASTATQIAEVVVGVYTNLIDLALQPGEAIPCHITARNQTGATISNGMIVALYEALGDNPRMVICDPCAADDQVRRPVGIAAGDTASGADGLIWRPGVLATGLDTSAYPDGSPLFASCFSPYGATNRTDGEAYAGMVVRQHGSEGIVFCFPDTPPQVTRGQYVALSNVVAGIDLQTVLNQGKVATNMGVQVGSITATNDGTRMTLNATGHPDIEYLDSLGASHTIQFGAVGIGFDSLELQDCNLTGTFGGEGASFYMARANHTGNEPLAALTNACDLRYINTNEASSISTAMVRNKAVTGNKIGMTNAAVTGYAVKVTVGAGWTNLYYGVDNTSTGGVGVTIEQLAVVSNETWRIGGSTNAAIEAARSVATNQAAASAAVAVWSNVQYPNAVLLDGSRKATKLWGDPIEGLALTNANYALRMYYDAANGLAVMMQGGAAEWAFTNEVPGTGYSTVAGKFKGTFGGVAIDAFVTNAKPNSVSGAMVVDRDLGTNKLSAAAVTSLLTGGSPAVNNLLMGAYYQQFNGGGKYGRLTFNGTNVILTVVTP